MALSKSIQFIISDGIEQNTERPTNWSIQIEAAPEAVIFHLMWNDHPKHSFVLHPEEWKNLAQDISKIIG